MDYGSVILSDESRSSPSGASGDRFPSLTFLFMAIVISNNVTRIPLDNIRDTRIFLGDGATSSVYKSAIEPKRGTSYFDPITVAIKQKRRRGSWFDHEVRLDSWLRAAYFDLRITSNCALRNSQNVLTALGYFWEKEELDGRTFLSPCLVLPVASKDAPTLDHFFSYLQGKRERLGMQTKMKLCHGIANGLAELHRAGVVHGDLKLSNILVFGDILEPSSLTLKLADFSHSLIISDFVTSSVQDRTYTGTRPFAIPEVRRQDRFLHESNTNGPDDRFSRVYAAKIEPGSFHACDVFGLGLLISAILDDGLYITTKIRKNVSDDMLVEHFLDRLCESPLGVLRYCKLSQQAWAPACQDILSAKTLSKKAEHCLEMCLQNVPMQRKSAYEIARAIKVCLEEDGISSKDLISSVEMIASPEKAFDCFGSLYEFFTLLPNYSPPETLSAIQSQILHELLHANQTPTKTSEFFLSCAYAIGLGSKIDMEKSVLHLERAAGLGHLDSWAIRDRIVSIITKKSSTRLKLVGTHVTPDFDYITRVRQTKAATSERGGFYVHLVTEKELKSYGFEKPKALSLSKDLDQLENETQKDLRMKSCRERVARARSPALKSEIRSNRDYNCWSGASTLSDLMENARIDSVNQEDKIKEPDESLGAALRTLAKIDRKLRADPKELQHFIKALLGDDWKSDISSRKPWNGDLIHLAIDFFGSLSSFDRQIRVLQFTKAVWMAQGDSCINKRNEYQETPLLLACRNGHALTVRFLISKGANVMHVDKLGLSALHWLGVFQDDECEIVGELLVKAGAPLEARTTDYLEIPEHCFNLQRDCTPLHYAVALRSLAAVRTLIRLGADPFATSKVALGFYKYEMTPLHFAISLQFYEIVEELLAIPGTISTVMFKTNSQSQMAPISIVHLINFHLFMASGVAPFARFILHNGKHEEAVEKTLISIFKVFPEKQILEPRRHRISNPALPAHDPYVWRIFKRLGVKMKQLTRRELGLQADSMADEKDIAVEFMLWAEAAMAGSQLYKSSSDLMEVALSDFDETRDEIDSVGLIKVVQLCIKENMDGPLRAIFSIRELYEYLADAMAIAFFKSAGYNAIEVMELIWSFYVQPTSNPEETAQKFLNFVENEMSPLHQAAKADAVQAVRFLLNKGANIDLDLGANGTPLCLAAKTFMSRRSAVLLLQGGANVYCCKAEGDGYNVLHASVTYSDTLLKGDQEFSVARTLIETNPARLLSENRDCINSRDRLGNTPLHTAILQDDLRTVEMFVETGAADLSIKNLIGWTPLMFSLYEQHFHKDKLRDLINHLSTKEIEFNPEDMQDQDWIEENMAKIVKTLIDAGSPIPEKERELTGAYMFLLQLAGMKLLLDSSDGKFEEKVQLYFGGFDFMKQPSPRTGLKATVLSADAGKLLFIYPDGVYPGAPCIEMKDTLKNPRA